MKAKRLDLFSTQVFPFQCKDMPFNIQYINVKSALIS